MLRTLFPVTKEAQHHDEQVDKVEIETQRSADRLLLGYLAAVAHHILGLDVLRVVCRQPGEHQNSGNRDDEVHHA